MEYIDELYLTTMGYKKEDPDPEFVANTIFYNGICPTCESEDWEQELLMDKGVMGYQHLFVCNECGANFKLLSKPYLGIVDRS